MKHTASPSLPTLVTYSLLQGELVLAGKSERQRKQLGQFLTPEPVARFMARQLGPIRADDKILDPAIGSGALACAIVERVIAQGHPQEFWIEGYEVDGKLCEAAHEALASAAKHARKSGVTVHFQLYARDFILDRTPATQLALFSPEPAGQTIPAPLYDHIIANPPYFKLNSNDPRVKAVSGQVKGHTNIYTLFIALAGRLLKPQGRACFIVPRSFCSGAYFAAFRREFIQTVSPLAIHLFESRQDTFKADSVLQENVIITFRRQQPERPALPSSLFISASKNVFDLNKKSMRRPVSTKHFIGRHNDSLFFRLPIGELDEQIVETIDSWNNSLGHFKLQVSTGPVVAFRAREFLTSTEAVAQEQAVPLLWLQNVKPQRVEWPVAVANKPQGILAVEKTRPLIIPAANYVLLRRFSAKEEPRRLIAAPLVADKFASQWIGLENHLNYVYRETGSLETDEAYGLAALFNSALMDRYFRIVNGNTQVNAAELRALPLPAMQIIKRIGQELLSAEDSKAEPDIDAIVFASLRATGHLPPDFPTIKETRFIMSKIQEAQNVLKAMGLPPAQQNEISALTLLVLAQLSEEMPWREARRQSLRIHDILAEIAERYDRQYAENTRETVRRQVIHQFEQAGIVVRNPDEPTLPTNSPRTHYALSDPTIRTIRAYGTERWDDAIQTFTAHKGALLEVYQKHREQQKIPLRLENGEEYHLSPGRHNELQAAIVEEFGPRFAPGATVLYLGDAANKTLVLDEAGLETLGISLSQHDKLPDIALYDTARNRLLLIEAVTSHGPISPKRHLELEEMLHECPVGRIYVSAFPDFATFKNFLAEIAWETEVWLAEIPDHLIHFNGDHFLKPRR